MKKIAVIGHFAFGKEFLDGQTVKTKITTQELERQLGSGQVLKFDTHGGKLSSLLKAPFQVFSALQKSENVLIFPAHNGLRIIAPLLYLLNGLFHRKLHYAVIGGWLPKFLQTRAGLAKRLKAFTGIYVETSTMKKALDSMGFENVHVMPNCKSLQLLQPEELPVQEKPYKLCTFSRVMREKGMEDAVNAVKAVNEAAGETVVTLDIYGPVDAGQTQWFEDLQKSFPAYVRYGGTVPFDRSVAVLKDYFALLFPTRFYTEGIPGTIIDAYAAGVPVISAKWESFADMVEDTVTGYGYEFENTQAFEKLLGEIAAKPEMITALKENCLRKARDYTPESAIKILLGQMEG